MSQELKNDLQPPYGADEFLAKLRAVGANAYHDKHPFQRAMNAGQLNPAQLRGWVANRFHYQRRLPIKDAAIVSNCPLPSVRRRWLHRISDHDGIAEGEGGIEAWLRLGEAAGLTREEMWDERHVVPIVRFSVDAYVQLARSSPWPVAVASSLTELFAPDLIADRLRAFELHYDWLSPSGLDYFRARVVQARIDANEGLHLTIAHCATRHLQLQALDALATKCAILWTMLDGVMGAYGSATAIRGEA